MPVALQTGPQADNSSKAALGPDFVLEVPGTTARIHVFGIDHRYSHPHVGEFILRTKPDAVVVETSVTAEHGAVPGNCIGCSDELVQGPQAFFVRMFCQVAAQLQEQMAAQLQKDGVFDPANIPFWHQIKDYYRGEQLAYIAAFATGAKLVFADRPKDITYRRMVALSSAAQLDESYGALCEAHYRHTLGLPEPQYPGHDLSPVEVITMQEREAVMCKVLDDACRRGLPQGGLPKPATSVVLVVGRSHLEGLHWLWQDKRWQQQVDSDDLASSRLMSTTGPAHPEDERDAGVRRGLLHAMMHMMVTQEVMMDMADTLGPVPPGQQQAVEAIEEIYSCNRMMLAALPKDLLQKVCTGLNCDMYEVLQPFRQLRAVNGGHVYDDEIIAELRGLNFEFTTE